MQYIGHQQQLLAARAGAVDVDCRVNAFFGHTAVKVNLHIAGAFEFFIDDIVHAAAGFDQGGGDDGQRPAFLDIARCAEEALRFL